MRVTASSSGGGTLGVAVRARVVLAAAVHEGVTASVARPLDLGHLAARRTDQAATRLDMAAVHATWRHRLEANPPEPWDDLTSEQAVARVDLSGPGVAVRAATRG